MTTNAAGPDYDVSKMIARTREADKAKGRGEYQFDKPMEEEPARNPWASLPCGVPGYDMTARAYARLVQSLAAKGDFVQVEHYLAEARKAGALDLIMFAVKPQEQG